METPVPTIHWNDGFVRVLKKEGEESQSLFWLHNKASIVATRYNDCLMIPSIVLQTITGFLSATSGLVPPLALGGISVFTAVLSTLLSYYKFSARSEGHKVVSQLYLRLYKKIEVELALPESQRTNATTLLSEVREKLSRIAEVAPPIPESIILLYKNQFKDSRTAKPIIANGLDQIVPFEEKVEDQIKISIR